MYKKENLLFIILGGFFITNALVAEFIAAKLFSLEKVFGLDPANLTLFGEEGLSFTLTVGGLLWPVVFVMTDIINEYYGKRGVRLLSYLAVVLISYAYLMVFLAIEAPPSDYWLERFSYIQPSIDTAFGTVFGLGLNIIIGSLIAFLVGQLLDVSVFQYLRRFTGEKKLWLRATGSTLVSQLIDSFVVTFIAFYLLASPESRFRFSQVLAIGGVGYVYKFTVAVILTPALYLIHGLIDSYLGKERAERLIQQAAGSSASEN
jgi:uncharacterized integral membrane protein (TIGR00697 family)